jgi:hypothetical protein
MEKESETRRHIGFKDGNFNEAVTEVHEETIVWSVFDFPTVMRVCAKKMRMAVAFAANVLNHMVEAERRQSPTRDPRKPAAHLVAQLDAARSGQAVGCDKQNKAAARQHYPVNLLHGNCL